MAPRRPSSRSSWRPGRPSGARRASRCRRRSSAARPRSTSGRAPSSASPHPGSALLDDGAPAADRADRGGATLRFAIAQLGGRVVRSRIDNRLEGDGSEVEQVEIVFGGRDQLFDLTAYTRHVGRDTTGNLLSKAVLQHGARAYVKGLISIEKTARGTDSFLGEFGMLLDKQSRSVTVPSLEIDQPDCRRAAHASSVGPIDPAQLFYLESRGITPDEARKFITLGFLEPVVARVPLEAEQERLWELLEAKWSDALGDGATHAAPAPVPARPSRSAPARRPPLGVGAAPAA